MYKITVFWLCLFAGVLYSFFSTAQASYLHAFYHHRILIFFSTPTHRLSDSIQVREEVNEDQANQELVLTFINDICIYISIAGDIPQNIADYPFLKDTQDPVVAFAWLSFGSLMRERFYSLSFFHEDSTIQESSRAFSESLSVLLHLAQVEVSHVWNRMKTYHAGREFRISYHPRRIYGWQQEHNIIQNWNRYLTIGQEEITALIAEREGALSTPLEPSSSELSADDEQLAGVVNASNHASSSNSDVAVRFSRRLLRLEPEFSGLDYHGLFSTSKF